jgi:hypothetical protein
MPTPLVVQEGQQQEHPIIALMKLLNNVGPGESALSPRWQRFEGGKGPMPRQGGQEMMLNYEFNPEWGTDLLKLLQQGPEQHTSPLMSILSQIILGHAR